MDGMNTEDQKRKAAAYHQRHKDITRAKRKLRQRRNAILVLEYLEAHPCVDCGEPDPIVLDFDHVRGGKTSSVSSMIDRACAMDVIKTEIAKCDVRCANCHRRRTAKDRGWKRKLVA